MAADATKFSDPRRIAKRDVASPCRAEDPVLLFNPKVGRVHHVFTGSFLFGGP